jgi:hypothetical protein
MGFLDDVFDNPITQKLGETAKDLGWAIGAPAATVYDLATAGFRSDMTVGGALAGGLEHSTQLFLGDNNGTPDDTSDDKSNILSPVVHKGLDGLEWLYDNAIAQPLNTANITEQRMLAGLTGTEDNAHPWDIGSAWNRADESKGGYSGQGTSIGRESAYTWDAIIGLVTGFRGSMTDEGQKQLDEHSKLFDAQSGVADFAGRWFLDPTIVLGKATKALKAAQLFREIKDPEKIASMLQESSKAGGLLDGFGDRTDAAVKWMTTPRSDGLVRSPAEIVAANRGLQDAAGDGWALAEAISSANKQMRTAGATEDEINQTVRNIALAGANDPQALKAIDDRASQARDALAALKSQRDDYSMAMDWAIRKSSPTALDAARRVASSLSDDVAQRGTDDFLSSDEFLNLTHARLQAVAPTVKAAQLEAARTERLANKFTGDDSLAGAVMKRPIIAGPRSGTGAMEKAANKESGLGPPAKLDFIFQSSAWNKAVKVATPAAKILTPHIYYGVKGWRMLNQVQAPRAIDMHDENAPLALNNFLKHSAVDPLKREELVGSMAGARTEGQKRAVVEDAIAHAQASLIDKYMKENPHFTDETAKAVIVKQAQEIAKQSKRLGLQTRKFTAHLKDDNTPGDMSMGEDGIAVYRPLLETQLENHIVLPDLKLFTKILDRHSGWLEDMAQWAQGNSLPDESRIQKVAQTLFGAKVEKKPWKADIYAKRIQTVRDREWQMRQFSEHALQGMLSFWKKSVLLRPAYPMKVLIDSDLRALAVLGPAAFGMHFAPRAFGFATMGSASRIKTHFAAHADEQRLIGLQADTEKFEQAWKSEHGDKAPITDEWYLGAKKDISDIEGRLELYRVGGRAGRNEAYGRFGEVGLNDVSTAAGKIPGAFADDYGRAQRSHISSKTTAGIMGDSQKIAMGNLLSEQWTSIDSSDPGHMDAWLKAVNHQLKQSELGKVALSAQLSNGDNPEAAVRALLAYRRTPEGKAVFARLGWTAADREGHAREIVGYVNHYLPTPELRQKALTQKIGQKDLEAAYPDPLSRPPVHGQAIAMATGKGNIAGKMINNWFDRTMKWLADAPEDQLARHPMYAAVYQQEARRQAELLMANPRVKDISLKEIQSQVQTKAHKEAQRAIKRYMFDVADQSDLSHALRFVSPFIAAWEDTIKKWGRIAVDNPDIPAKGYLLWNAPNSMGLVVDENGNPVKSDDFNANHFMILQVPSWSPIFSGKKVKVLDQNFRIPKQAMNIVLQGGLQPGFGPLVAIPVGELQMHNPTLNDVAKFVNPYGPPESVWDAVAPATVKRITELVNQNSRAHMMTTETIYMQELGRHRQDPEKYPAPTWDSASRKANAIGLLKIANNAANPTPAIFDSPYKMYQDAYRKLQEQERRDPNLPRGWADDQFIKGYGESFFPLVQSKSKNYGGLGSTAEAKDAAVKYKKQISQYGMEAGSPNKTLVQLIVGPEGEGAYNESAHRWQETNTISPGSGYNYRSYSNAQQAAADADSNLGWYKFRQKMNELDSRANQEGYRTYSEDQLLVDEKNQFVDALKQENPSWQADYESMDPGKFARDLGKLAEVANSNTFTGQVERTDMAGVRQYLTLRQALSDQLTQLDISPTSQDAIPLKAQFTDAVMDLVGNNTKFSEWAFHPFLSRDPMLEGLITDPTTGQLTVDQTAAQWGFN